MNRVPQVELFLNTDTTPLAVFGEEYRRTHAKPDDGTGAFDIKDDGQFYGHSLRGDIIHVAVGIEL